MFTLNNNINNNETGEFVQLRDVSMTGVNSIVEVGILESEGFFEAGIPFWLPCEQYETY